MTLGNGFRVLVEVLKALATSGVKKRYQATEIDWIDEMKEHFCAICVELQVKHPVVSTMLQAARRSLFGDEQSWDE